MPKFSRNERGKVLFIEPRAPDYHIFSVFPLPRLGPIILATMLKEAGIETSVVVEAIRETTPEAVLEADVVGITTTTSTATRAYAWADEIRRLGKTVVMGGPHVTFMPREALEHADVVVMGEAESIVVELFGRLLDGRPVEDIAGVVTARSDATAFLARAPAVADLDQLPAPDLSLVPGMSVKSGFARKTVVPVQASRGCPFNCSFCSVTRMFGHRYRYRSIDNLMKEIGGYDSDDMHVFFYDDNLAADRRWFRRFLERLDKDGTRFQWSAQVRIEVTRDPELLELMARTHCSTVYVGVESLDPDALKSMKKHQTPEAIRTAMERFNESGVDVHGMFVLGADTDTPESVRRTVDYAIRAGFTSAQFLILTPFPGTPVWDDLASKGRIRFGDLSLYDCHHVTFQPARMSMETLQYMQLQAHDRFYGWSRTLARLFTGRLGAAFIFLYARWLNHHWQHRNRVYMKHLKLMSRSGGPIPSLRLPRVPHPG